MALYAFDGTLNKDEEDPKGDTNVVKFLEAYDKGAKNKNGSEYISGVGTRFGFFGKLLGGFAGVGGKKRIEEMYEELEEHYNDGDTNIDIIGFSRGAALAVHFSNVLNEKGIKLKDGNVIKPKIRFLGVWDIVGSFGMPINFILPFQELNIGYNLDVPENVEHCFHAMALNERRQTYDVTRLDIENLNNDIEECWFRGVHSDVGGGNGNTHLSNITLQWMLDKAKDCGLPIEEESITELNDQIDPSAEIGSNIDVIVNPRRVTYKNDKYHPSIENIILKVGTKETFTINSKDRFSWSGIHLVKGGKYNFTFPPGQKWTDGSQECGPDGWTTEVLPFYKEYPIKLMERRRRYPEANWFEVIGALGKSDDLLFRIGDGSKSTTPYVSPADADLYAFANDLRLMYYNNKGSMKVCVERLS